MITQIHDNSLTAFHSLNREHRREFVLKAYKACGSLTDREVKEYLGLEDMDEVRPRISEMIKIGILVECGERIDLKTRRPVRISRIKLPGEDKQAELFGLAAFNRHSRVKLAELS
jgi:hypothetical protein